MFASPADEWSALTAHYRSMVDEELLELAADFHNLTPTAQQVLRDEMRLRELGDPLFGAAARELPTTAPPAPGPGPVEYTWKTLLCPCDSDEQAWQIAEMLRRAGIESWIEGPTTYANSSGSQEINFDSGSRRVMVAADQLEQARAIAAQPVPADIVEQSQTAPPEFEPPVCPRCGADDPLLEEVDPVNSWKCEACGAEWTDPEPDPGPAA